MSIKEFVEWLIPLENLDFKIVFTVIHENNRDTFMIKNVNEVGKILQKIVPRPIIKQEDYHICINKAKIKGETYNDPCRIFRLVAERRLRLRSDFCTRKCR